MRPGTVYRLYDADGELLYVGCTMNGASRLGSHKSKPWWPEVASATFTHYESFDEAGLAEIAAIAAEKPKYPRHSHPRIPLTEQEITFRVDGAKRRRAAQVAA